MPVDVDAPSIDQPQEIIDNENADFLYFFEDAK
jgi:hypothetical protein